MSDQITLPAGTIVKVNGMPFRLHADTTVDGRTENLQQPEDGDADGAKPCRYTNEPGGACWREGAAVKMCTCHTMADKDFAESVKRHAECRAPNADAAVKMERERCARIAEGFDAGGHIVVDEIAAAIRGIPANFPQI